MCFGLIESTQPEPSANCKLQGHFIFGETGERYDFVVTADQPVGAYWVQLRGLGECGIKRVQQLAILRYARGPYQPATTAPTYDVGIPQGVVSVPLTFCSSVRPIFNLSQLGEKRTESTVNTKQKLRLSTVNTRR